MHGLYRIMIEKARSERKSVQVPIRCDSPELRREIMISLKSVGNGHIEFLCRTMQAWFFIHIGRLQGGTHAEPPRQS